MRIFGAAICLLAALVFGTTSAFASVAGKTIKYRNNEGQTYWTTYHKNGTSSSKSTKRGGGCCVYDTGHWRYNSRGDLCERYDHWHGGTEFCRSTSGSQYEAAIKSDEQVPLFPVYWVAHCKSMLKSFAGIDKLEGPSEISLSLKHEKVYARRQGCSRPVQGAMVMVKAGAIKSHSQATLVFRVRYNTKDGPRQSKHRVSLDLYP